MKGKRLNVLTVVYLRDRGNTNDEPNTERQKLHKAHRADFEEAVRQLNETEENLTMGLYGGGQVGVSSGVVSFVEKWNPAPTEVDYPDFVVSFSTTKLETATGILNTLSGVERSVDGHLRPRIVEKISVTFYWE